MTLQKENSRLEPNIARICICLLAVLLTSQLAQAAPFRDLHIPFVQPDGTKIEIIGSGDEFYAEFETIDGYSVLFDPSLKAYCYARQSADGTLISTGVQAHQALPSALGLAKHFRSSPAARDKQIRERRQRWEQDMEIEPRWKARKAELQQFGAQASGGVETPTGPEPSPPSSTTTGQKMGLTLLIDFDDDPATIPQSEIFNFCNGDNYTSYGNNGSVRKYYQDVSNGLLIYSNVVTIYVRIPNSLHPKSYYNDTTKDDGTQGRLLINDALGILKAMTNYNTDILPTFGALTVDGSSRVMAFNVYYAGDNGGVWSKGLWPHSWVLASAVSLGNGKSVYKYQISNIGSALEIGTFCHENGHMLCGYPDLYDYTYNSSGVGDYCLMASGSWGGSPAGSNPEQICAYLKRASGWATTINVASNSVFPATVTATAGTNFNHFYRYQKPGVSTEYFLVECRYQSGHDAALPGAGAVIWHIDELGNNSTVNLNPNSSHNNYEATVVQADNRWDLERNVNSGDNLDFYFSGNTATGYANTFSDTNLPSAHWWDGSASGLIFRNFSSIASTVNFSVGNPIPPSITGSVTNRTIECGANTNLFAITASGTPPLSIQWKLDSTNVLGATNVNFGVTNLTMPSHSVTVSVTNLYGTVSSNATLAVQDTRPPTITLNGANPFYVELGTAFIDPGATATDTCLGLRSVTTNGIVNTNVLGTNVLTYTATDGYNTTNNTRTVIVRDTTPPTITWSFTNLVLAADTNCVAAMPDVTGTNYILATDLSGALTITQSPTNNAILPLATNVIVITVADASGNKSYSTNRIVMQDQTPPIIAINGFNPMTNELGITFIDPGVIASDCSGISLLRTNGTVNISLIGTNTLTYVAVDGNTNTNTVTRTVIVRDTTPPTINWSLTNLVLAADSNCVAAMPDVTGTNYILATDLSGALNITQSPTINAILPLVTNVVVITVADASGNKAYSTNFIAVSDQTPPVVTLNGPSLMTNMLGAVFTDPGATASDACSGIGLFTTNGTVNINAAGSYQLTYTAADGSNNTNSATRIVLVATNPSPLLVVNATNLDFGTVVVSNSSTQTFQVVNLGGSLLTGTATSAVPFFVVSNSLFSVPPGQTDFVQVAFSPMQVGIFSTNLVFASSGGNSTNILSGVAVTPGLILVSGNRDFGWVAVGTSELHTFTVTNVGGATVTNGLVSVDQPFSVWSDSNFTVAGFGTTNILVQFTPTVTGTVSNRVIFTSGNGGGQTNFLIGSGVIPVAIQSPMIVSNQLGFSMQTVPGWYYRIQSSTNLRDWTYISALYSWTNAVIPFWKTMSEAQCFYRVFAKPADPLPNTFTDNFGSSSNLAANWTAELGTWKTGSGSLTHNAGTNGILTFYWPLVSSDGDMQIQLKFTGVATNDIGQGLVFAYQDSSNYSIAQYSRSMNRFEIIKLENGARSTEADVDAASLGFSPGNYSAYWIKLKWSSSGEIDFFFGTTVNNAVLVLQINDPMTTFMGQKVGVYDGSTRAHTFGGAFILNQR